MSTNKHIDKICVIVVVIAVIITLLFMNGEKLGLQVIASADEEEHSDDVLFTEMDLDCGWDDADITQVTLTGDNATINGSGSCYFANGDLTITDDGYYEISGSLDDGSIIIEADKKALICICLNGVDITASEDACIRVNQADKVFLTLADGSENTLTSGAEYSNEALADGTDGAIFAHDDLTINGSGSLDITAEYKHGIAANDDLVITGGNISITASADAIHVNDSFRFCDASLTIDCDDDGIHSDTEIFLESGSILITSCYEGIESPLIRMDGGDVSIYPTDDGFNASSGTSSGFGFGGFEGFGGGDMGGGNMDNRDMGGSMPDMSDGEMPEMPDTADMPEMPDTADMEAKAETDDADAETDAAIDEDFGADLDITPNENGCIIITGGTLTIINENGNDADGLDSNGDIYITGGEILISVANSGSNSAIDYGSESGGVCEISGGTVLACGSSSMAESFDSTSSQPSILYTCSAGTEAGKEVSLQDADGNTILSYTIPCSFSSLNISCPQMTVGETYILVIGEDSEEITVSEMSASYGDTASSMGGGSSNMEGMGHGGGNGGMGHGDRSDRSDNIN